jgi:O-antigen/teichoic acid export membrane protein
MFPPMSDLFGRSPLASRLAGGGAAGLGTRLGKAALSIATAALLARTLSPSAFGVYLLGQTVVLFGSVVAVLGLENTLVREVAGLVARGKQGAIRSTLRRARGLTLFGAVTVAAILVIERGGLLRRLFDEPELTAMAGWLTVWVALEALSRLQVSALRGEHRLLVAAALDGFLQAVVFLAAVAWMAANGMVELEGLFIAGAVSSGLSAATGWWLLARPAEEGVGVGGSEFDGEELVGAISAVTLWNRSWPLLGATMLGFLISQGDLWMVGIVAASESAALYGSVLKLIFLVSLPLFVLNRTLSSTLAEFHVRGWTREVELLLRGTTTMVTAATSIMVLGLLLFGSRVLTLVFGEFYAAAMPVLVLLALAELVSAATGPCGTMLMMAGHVRLQLAVSAASVASLLLGSLWVGAHYGMLGVASVSASTKVLNNVMTMVLVRRCVGVWSHAYLSPLRVREGLTRMARVARTYAS